MAQTALAVPVTRVQEEHVLAAWELLLEKAGRALRAGVLVTAPASDFSPLPGQPRTFFSPESMRRMNESVKGSLGQVHEGIARLAPPGVATKYQIIDGERRWRAVTAAGIEYRAKIIEIDDESIPYLMAAISNYHHQGHTVTETVRSIQYFLGLGMPWETVATMHDLSVAYAQKLYTLLNLIPEVMDMLDQGRVKTQILPTMAAVEVARLQGKDQLALANRILAEKLTIAHTRSEVDTIERVSGKAPSRRTRAPRKTMRSVANRCGVIAGLSKGLLTVLESDEIKLVLAGRSDEEVRRLTTNLEGAGERIARIIDLIREKRPLPEHAD